MKARCLPLLLFVSSLCSAQTFRYSTVVLFPQTPDTQPENIGPLVIDSSGNLFTTRNTDANGSYTFGTVYKVTPKGVLSTVYTFSGGKDGAYPGSLTRDGAGNLYGVTYSGGAKGGGTIFKITLTGKETTLHTFATGSSASSPLKVDASGNLYGYSSVGSTVSIFKLTPKGAFSTVHNFCSQTNCTDGKAPQGSLIIDTAGNFYGTTQMGGTFGFGVVFKLNSKFKYSVLHNFTGGADGANPQGKLTQNASGLMYGSTSSTVFSITSGGAFSTLFTFAPPPWPWGPISSDSAGNLYEVTMGNGSYNQDGTVIEISPTGVVTTINDFGSYWPGLVLDKAGDVYGTTVDYGLDGGGPSIFELTKN